MSLPYVVDGETDLDSAFFNPVIDRVNGEAGPLANMRAGVAHLLDYVTPSADATANRVAIQSLLDNMAGSQATLIIPPRYDSGNPDPIVLNSNGVDAWCLDVPSSVTIEGAGVGSSLKLADNQANFTRLLLVQERENVAIRSLRLDGNKAGNPSNYEHNHCIMIWDSTDVLLEDVVTVDSTGDGVFVGGSVPTISERIWINRCTATGNRRNPVTVNEVSDAWVTNCYLICESTGGQAVDSEPDVHVNLSGLLVANNVLGHLGAGDVFAVSIAGRPGYPRRGTRVIGNHFISGGVFASFSADSVIAWNTGKISQVFAYYENEHVSLIGNNWEALTTGYAIDLAYSGGTFPTDWLIAGNQIESTSAGQLIGIRSAKRVRVSGNRLSGGTWAGVYVQTTGGDTQDIAIVDNDIGDTGRGINIIPSASYATEGIVIGNNIFHDITNHALDLGATTYINKLAIGPNTYRNCGGLLAVGAIPFLVGGVAGAGGAWSCSGTPEGQITEVIGATATRRDGGASTTLYVKESGSGNTGWRAV